MKGMPLHARRSSLTPPAAPSPGSAPAPGPVPLAVVLHGFQGSRSQHKGLAERLSRRGVAVLSLDLLPLLGWSVARSALERLRDAAVADVVAHVKGAVKGDGVQTGTTTTTTIDATRVVLCGFSAGGAVAMEAAARLAMDRGDDAVRPVGVILLDAVPWERTVRAVVEAARWDAGAIVGPTMEGPGQRQRADGARACVVGSVRGEPSSWNANGLVRVLLARGIGNNAEPGSDAEKERTFTDVVVVGAKHGDFMDPAGREGFSGLGFYGMKMLGLLTDKKRQQACARLAEEFILATTQVSSAETYVSTLKEMQAQGLVKITENMRAGDVPDLMSAIPSYMR